MLYKKSSHLKQLLLRMLNTLNNSDCTNLTKPWFQSCPVWPTKGHMRLQKLLIFMCERQLLRTRKMDLRSASQTAGRTASGNEQVVRCMTGRQSQELHLDLIPDHLSSRRGVGERQTVKTGQDADPHYVWFHQAEIRSVCRPPSKSGGRYGHVGL